MTAGRNGLFESNLHPLLSLFRLSDGGCDGIGAGRAALLRAASLRAASLLCVKLLRVRLPSSAQCWNSSATVQGSLCVKPELLRASLGRFGELWGGQLAGSAGALGVPVPL